MEYRCGSWRANRVDLHCSRDAGIMESHHICNTIVGSRILRIAPARLGCRNMSHQARIIESSPGGAPMHARTCHSPMIHRGTPSGTQFISWQSRRPLQRRRACE